MTLTHPDELREQAATVRTWSDPHDCDDIPCPTYGDTCPWQIAGALDLEADWLESTLPQCSANVGGDPVSGCDSFAVAGSDYCPAHT